MSTGLEFSGTGTARFQWANPNLNGLPQYGPSGIGVTYIVRYYPGDKDGYYTTLFWARGDGQLPTSEPYYGFHPYPDPPTTGTPKWEISIRGTDQLGAVVTFDTWHTQVFRAKGAAGQYKTHEFYTNWPDTGELISYSTEAAFDSTYGDTPPVAPALICGDASWSSGNEQCKGVLRGFQIYADYLSLADIASELASPLSTGAGAASVWYLNVNPTPSDISDKSGQGNDPAWSTADRPALWQGDFDSRGGVKAVPVGAYGGGGMFR